MIATSILDQAQTELGGFLPRLGGALVLLVVGVLLARLVARLVGKALNVGGLDDLADRWGVSDATERAGLGRPLSAIICRALRIGLTLVVIFAALSLLGLQFLEESLNEAVLLLPKLLVAGALLLAGVVVGGFARHAVERTTAQMDLPLSLGRAAQVVIIAVFAITAAAQVEVSTEILTTWGSILLAGVVLTFAIAFGLGGQGLARELSAGRHVRAAYTPGQEISVGDVRGEVVAVETASTVLRDRAGQTVRVPNDLLLTAVVTVHGDTAGAPDSGSQPV